MLKVLPFFAGHLLTLILAVSVSDPARAESDEAAVKTAFLYNFFKFIEWPAAVAKQSTYNLCTTVNDHLGDSLSVLEGKSIGDKPLLILRNIESADLQHCQMVFIGSSENAAAIIRKLKGLPVVTVGDTPDFTGQGGMIGLVQDDSRLSFEINLAVANADGIHISAKLLKLAKSVNTAE